MANRTLSDATLLDTPVALWIGDSNVRGSALDEASETWVDDADVLSLNSSGAFAQYDPRTFTGLSNDANNGNIGSEMEWARLFRIDNPKKKLHIIKCASSGSAASKLNTGTLTASVSGFALTVTAGSTVTGDLIYGSTLPTGCYNQSGAGPYNLAQCSQQIVPFFGDADASVNQTIASTTLSKANAYLSWAPADGKLFYLMFRRLTQGFHKLAQEGKNPYLAVVNVGLGANDSGDATAAGVHQSSLVNIYRALKASPYWGPKTRFVVDRVPITGAGANYPAVRTAQANFKGQYRDVRLHDCDSYDKQNPDAIHYTLLGQNQKGAGQYALFTGASAGL